MEEHKACLTTATQTNQIEDRQEAVTGRSGLSTGNLILPRLSAHIAQTASDVVQRTNDVMRPGHALGSANRTSLFIDVITS